MSTIRVAIAAAFTVCAFIAPTPAQADKSAEWRFDAQIASRINPTGIRLNPAAAIRRGLFDSENPLLKGAYVEIGGAIPTTPVSSFQQIYLEAVPIAPILLRATASKLRYFGVLGVITELENGDTNWSPAVLDAAMEEGGGVSTSGADSSLLAKLRLKFGKVLATATYDQHWISLDVPNTSNWYDPYMDLMFHQKDQYTITTGFAGYVASGDLDADKFLLLAGKFERFSAKRSDINRDIANLMAVWRPGWRAEDKLTLGAVLGYYLDDPYREGQPVVAVFAAASWGGPLKE